jgi:hypothetical protein
MLTRALAHCCYRKQESPDAAAGSHAYVHCSLMPTLSIFRLFVQPAWPGTMVYRRAQHPTHVSAWNSIGKLAQGTHVYALQGWICCVSRAPELRVCCGAASPSAGTASPNQTKWMSQCWLTRRTCQAPDPVQIAVQARPAQAYVFMCLSPFDLQSGQPCIAITHTALER